MSPHPATLDEAQLLAQCTTSTNRRGGPGGQHRNKVETAVLVTHTPTGTTAEANERRSQEANRRVAIHRLRLRLAVEVRAPATDASPLWLSRLRGHRVEVNDQHADFPALVAEALDQLAHCEWNTRAAAERLGTSATQLVKLLKKCPAAITLLNDRRTARGLKPLK